MILIDNPSRLWMFAVDFTVAVKGLSGVGTFLVSWTVQCLWLFGDRFDPAGAPVFLIEGFHKLFQNFRADITRARIIRPTRRRASGHWYVKCLCQISK